jgi:large subunit ribosomal protein L13e
MVKHNNVVPNGHFHKDWMHYVKTWFNQAGRKARRRHARSLKAAKLSPNPLKALRPLVQGQTLRYCARTKKGRGFSLQEIKKAGLTAQFARTIGVKVDHRRRNKSAETLQRNVSELEFYKSKLTLYPLKDGKPKKGQINDVKASS